MTEPQSPPNPRTAARVIHIAVTIGLVVLFGILSYLRASGTREPGLAADTLRLIGYALLFTTLLTSWIARTRITSPERGSDLAEWWRANTSRAIVCWALAEGGGLSAMVLGWLAADATLMGAGLLLSVMLLFLARPRALEGP